MFGSEYHCAVGLNLDTLTPPGAKAGFFKSQIPTSKSRISIKLFEAFDFLPARTRINWKTGSIVTAWLMYLSHLYFCVPRLHA